MQNFVDHWKRTIAERVIFAAVIVVLVINESLLTAGSIVDTARP